MLTLFRNASVYAPTALGLRDVLVAGDRIAAVSPSLPRAPEGWPVEEVDLTGKVLAPGLVDAHTHMTGGGGEGGSETRVPPRMLSELTLAGVTTAIGLLGTDCTTRSIAELLATARGLEALGMTALCYTGGYQVPPPTLTGSVRGDIVHIDRIVAAGEVALSDHRSSQPTFDELARLAADVHVAGMMTKKAGLLHLHMGDGPRGLSLVRRILDETELPARVFHPTHCNRNRKLWAEAKELSARGGYIDVTSFPPEEGEPTAAEDIADWLRSGLDPARITLSSDGGGCLPVFDSHGALEKMDVGQSSSLLAAVRELVGLGIDLAQALAPCTANVARLFRLSGKGRVEVGADADLLVLGEGLGVEAVYARGTCLVRDGEAVVKGLFER